jgi:CAAX prenyl protease-like protein
VKRNTAAFCALGALALPGIASIALIVPELLQRAPGAHPLPMPVPLLTAIAIAQVALLTAIAIAVGLATAPRAGLHSAIVQRVHGEPAGRIDAVLGSSAGVALAAALWIADRLLAAYDPALAEAIANAMPSDWLLRLTGVFYGGVVEELLMRWGLVSLVAWGAWRLFQRGEPRPSIGVLHVAVLVAAIVFALAHLPGAAAQGLTATPVLTARIIAGNAIAGLVLGVLYLRNVLETAMICHATFHAVLFMIA